ncbi:MAG: hypothetical protein ABWZ25_08900 [Chitinophagaceae bacterium]
MEQHELIIQFRPDGVYLSPDKWITLEQAGFEKIPGKESPDASWRVRIIKNIEEEERIFCEIIEYKKGQIPFGAWQLRFFEALGGVTSVSFRSVDTRSRLQTLPGIRDYSPGQSTEEVVYIARPIVYEYQRESVKQHFSVPFKKVQFENGQVSFDYRIERLNQPIRITVPNSVIREEFDAVKNYFGKALGFKKINGTIQIEMEGPQVISSIGFSSEIEMITADTVESVQFSLTKDILKKATKEDGAHTIVDADELFNSVANLPVSSEAFFENEGNLLEKLIQLSDSKHYRHLRYLSSRQLFDKQRLRFVLRPFSFLFLLQGKSKLHVIWETLNTSEATYMWRVGEEPLELPIRLKQIDGLILQMKLTGKTSYLQSNDDGFVRIKHDYTDADGGLAKWMAELEYQLGE